MQGLQESARLAQAIVGAQIRLDLREYCVHFSVFLYPLTGIEGMCRGFDQSGIRTRVRRGIFYVFLRVPLMMIGEENGD